MLKNIIVVFFLFIQLTSASLQASERQVIFHYTEEALLKITESYLKQYNVSGEGELSIKDIELLSINGYTYRDKKNKQELTLYHVKFCVEGSLLIDKTNQNVPLPLVRLTAPELAYSLITHPLAPLFQLIRPEYEIDEEFLRNPRPSVDIRGTKHQSIKRGDSFGFRVDSNFIRQLNVAQDWQDIQSLIARGEKEFYIEFSTPDWLKDLKLRNVIKCQFSSSELERNQYILITVNFDGKVFSTTSESKAID